MHLYILDEHGEPVGTDDVLLWATWFETSHAARQVRVDYFEHDFPPSEDQMRAAVYSRRAGEHAVTATDLRICVSTVFLSIDRSYGYGVPVLWETMIFGGPESEWQDHYTSRGDAIAGHAACCDRTRALIAEHATEKEAATDGDRDSDRRHDP
jgi:hypothetical protein